jgi:hypothetical protein
MINKTGITGLASTCRTTARRHKGQIRAVRKMDTQQTGKRSIIYRRPMRDGLRGGEPLSRRCSATSIILRRNVLVHARGLAADATHFSNLADIFTVSWARMASKHSSETASVACNRDRHLATNDDNNRLLQDE